MSITKTLCDAISGELANHLAGLPEAQRQSTAAHYRRQCEDYATLARMRHFPEHATQALKAAKHIPGANDLQPAQLLRVLRDAYDIAAALRKH